MPKGHRTMGVGVSETAAMKDKELVTFSVSFSLLFFTILDSVGGRIIELIEVLLKKNFIEVYYFLLYSLIFSPCFSRFLHRSHFGAIEGDWIIELIKVKMLIKAGSGFCPCDIEFFVIVICVWKWIYVTIATRQKLRPSKPVFAFDKINVDRFLNYDI